jgi:hypothetical protein
LPCPYLKKETETNNSHNYNYYPECAEPHAEGTDCEYDDPNSTINTWEQCPIYQLKAELESAKKHWLEYMKAFADSNDHNTRLQEELEEVSGEALSKGVQIETLKSQIRGLESDLAGEDNLKKIVEQLEASYGKENAELKSRIERAIAANDPQTPAGVRRIRILRGEE